MNQPRAAALPPSPPPSPVSPADPPGADLDRLLFDRILTLAALETDRPPTAALGLDRAALERLIARHVPEMRAVLDSVCPAPPAEEAIEEADLRAYILEHRAGRPPGEGGDEEAWLAAIVARRSLGRNHLWQDMGFANRGELNAMFRRHFPALVAANAGDMKWKKFFYRQLCAREGFVLCKSPNCETCDDYRECFGGEPGDPLHAVRAIAGEK